MSEQPKKKIYLIDGTSYLYRAFYAIKNLATSKGFPTNALYGFCMILQRIIKEEKPDYIALAFDVGGKTFREESFAEYKAQRQATPDALKEQIPLAREIALAYRFPLFEMEGFEADDLLATLARKAEQKGLAVYVATNDKDMLQLVNENIKVLHFHPEKSIYDRKKVKEKYEIEPEQFPDFLGLMGDSADNIPGVPGIGKKSAKEVLLQFKTIESALEHIDEIKLKKAKEALTVHSDEAKKSKELATLRYDLPIDLDLNALELGKPDIEKLTELFTKLEFRSFLAEIGTLKAEVSSSVELFEIKNSKDIKKLESLFLSSKKVGWFSASDEKHSLIANPVYISLAFEKEKAFLINFNSTFCKEHREELISILKMAWERKELLKTFYDVKKEMLMLKKFDFSVPQKSFDCMIASYLLFPLRSKHKLESLAVEFLSENLPPFADEEQDEEVKNKIGLRASVLFRLNEKLEQKLKEYELISLFYDVEMVLAFVLADMEAEGVKIDVDYLAKLSKELEGELGELAKEIFTFAGEEFNINSPAQVSKILFDKLELAKGRKTKTGMSTDVDVLQNLSRKHPLPGLILKYRKLQKYKSGYTDALPKLILPETGRIHTSFNQTITATGRLSSSDPNLQNIPIKDELARRIRRAFIPSSSRHLILSADYSQIDLRMLAHISKDERLLEAFKNGEDIHKHTAIEIFGVLPEMITAEMRRTAKVVNFGVIYGMTPYGLSKELGISVDEAKAFIDGFFIKYKRVKQYMEETIEIARKEGYVKTILGRRRYVPEINDANKNQREFAERAAINAPIQGSAADIIKLAMVKIQSELLKKHSGVKLLIQVHDELVFEVPSSEIMEVRKEVKEIMESPLPLSVPLVVDIKTGENWDIK